jgi:RNA polymerase sigma-70 factor (ECF subfamily)
MLFRVAFRRLRNVEDAEDAVQDALLSAYKHLAQFEGRSQLSSWLTRIVINTAGMKLRSRPRHEAASLDYVPEDGGTTLANRLLDAGPSPEAVYAEKEMEKLLSRALSRVSPRLRTAFQMREMAGFSTRETAYVLGITPDALKCRVNRARTAVRLYLKKVGRKRLTGKSKTPVFKQTAITTRRGTLRQDRGGFGVRHRSLPKGSTPLRGRGFAVRSGS